MYRLGTLLKPRRTYSSKFSFKKSPIINKKPNLSKASDTVNPITPARTRFAPSPTGYVHFGSLRTALYNYLLAKSTGGQYLLRLEDTDQSRLVPDAEANIYETLNWCGIEMDEGPEIPDSPYGPYRQSQRKDIYQKYANILLETGHAYYCYCSKERLNSLRHSATKLKPPTNVTYDRKCYHEPQDDDCSERVIRFRAPDKYDPVTDLLHGTLNLQPQYNPEDRRYDDIVILKSDGLPTYHFANVVDDHLMNITHVIRGEEWLSSTPKHIAMYKAFGWTPPKFIHIPLLTSLEDKKLSKRQGEKGIIQLRNSDILPEALINFVALFGWSPPRLVPGESVSEVMTMKDLIENFSLDNLTKGNAKVNDSKLYFFNKRHIKDSAESDDRLNALVDSYYPVFQSKTNNNYDKQYLKKLIKGVSQKINHLGEIYSIHYYLFGPIDYSLTSIPQGALNVLNKLLPVFKEDLNEWVHNVLQTHPETSKKELFQCLRFALAGGTSGLTIPLITDLLGPKETLVRIKNAIDFLLK